MATRKGSKKGQSRAAGGSRAGNGVATPLRRRVIELHIQGKKPTEIAEIVSKEAGRARPYDASTVCHTLARPEVKAEIAERLAGIRAEVDERIRLASLEALDGVLGIARDGTEAGAVRLRAWESVLDRAGMTPPKEVRISGGDGPPIRTESRIDLATLSPEQIAEYRKLARARIEATEESE